MKAALPSRVLIAWTWQVGCSGAPAHEVVTVSPTHEVVTASPTAPAAVIFAAGAPCHDEVSLVQEAQKSAAALKRGLEKVGVLSVSVVSDPSAEAVLETVRATRGPRLIAYTGHAVLLGPDQQLVTECPVCGGRCRSALCLSGQKKLLLDELVAAVPETAASALLLIDACSSAHVDVRLARAPVTVISASPFSTRVGISGMTPLSAAFEQLPTDLDLDCDNRFADWELFEALRNAIPTVDRASAQPKLRSQARFGSPSVVTSGRLECWPEKKLRDEVVRPESRPLHCGQSQRRRVAGFVEPQSPLPVGEAMYEADQLLAIPCEDDAGQCFRVSPDPACQRASKGAGCDVW